MTPPPPANAPDRVPGTGSDHPAPRRLAEAMGGGLVLEETGPEGSTFRLDLRPAPAPLPAPRPTSRPGGSSPGSTEAAATILCIEDNLTNLSLVDLHLPDVPGDEVLDRLRADPSTAGIPVVVGSADATSASRARLRAAGADAYLAKPLELDDFLATVVRFLPDGAGGK